jgi:Ca-activated chloride channel family protein
MDKTMIDFSQFHFIRPLWLLALLPLAIIIWLLAVRKLGNRSWETVCDAELLPFILIGRSTQTQRWTVGLIGLCGLLAILSLAGPAWERLPQPVFRSQSALVIALDLSRSMEATDIQPSRLERARFKIIDLLKQRREGQTALLVYAGDAFVVTPLTDDTSTIESQLPALSTSLMPAQGSNTVSALEKAEQLLKQGGMSKGHILLVTDEVDISGTRKIISKLREQDYRISILGVGTREGSPVTLFNGGFLKDKSGSIVIPVLDSQTLQTVATSGGGRYMEIGMDDRDINSLSEYFASDQINDEGKPSEFETDIWMEQGPWLILILLPLAALSFRRGYMVIVIFCMLPLPEPVNAFEWHDLWQTPDQLGKQALDKGEPDAAAALFSDPEWKAAAHYRSGNFEAAEQILENHDDAESLYNKGNALARQGRFEEAIAAYDQALELLPKHEDAQFNRELIEKELQQQQQQQSQSSSEKETEDQDKSSEQEQQQGDAGTSQQQSDGQDSNKDQDQSASDTQTNEENMGQDNKEEQNEIEQSETQSTEQDQNKNEAEKSHATSDPEKPDEEIQANEQWLRRIPDDPGGLLRRKFQYQYQRQARKQIEGGKTW